MVRYKQAEVAEQADAHDSKSCSGRSEGSIPSFGTKRLYQSHRNAAYSCGVFGYWVFLFLPGSGQRRANDARFISELRRDDGRFHFEHGQVFFMVLANAAAQDEQVGPE